jgi:ATP-binding cassette subfamily B protein
MSREGYTSFELWRRVGAQVGPYWRHLAVLLLLNLLSAPLALLVPLPLKITVDSVIGSAPLPEFIAFFVPGADGQSGTGVLLFAAILVMVVALLMQFQSLLNSYLSMYTGEKLVLAFRSHLFRHVQRLSFSYHDVKGTSDSNYRIQYDAPALKWLTIDCLIPLATAVVTLAAMLFVTFRINFQLALVALVVIPALLCLSWSYVGRLRGRWHKVKESESAALAVVHEVLAALRVVSAFGQEDRERDRFVRHSNDCFSARLRATLAEGWFYCLVGLITAFGTAAVLFIGTSHVQSGALTLGELLLVMAYLAQLYLPLQSIVKSAASLQGSLASAERALVLLDEFPEPGERPNARAITRTTGAVTFQNVSFGYAQDHPVLYDISFVARPGTRVGIAGPTGAGKTTLMSLLTRFYDPNQGQILLDGVDLRDYKLADLRNQFAIVLQEPVLFSTSIAENIAYARSEASMEEIVEAAKAANAHDFIEQLPQGYQTLVGERGMCLSGGERQRIGLARAFLKNAPILILDEPTSSVDVQTEAVIMEAMRRLMQGRTSFMIAHRLTTLEYCEVLLTIENGRFVHQRTTNQKSSAQADGGAKVVGLA